MKMNLSEANNTFMSDNLLFFHGATALFTCNLLVCLPPNVYVVWLIASGAGGPVASEIFALNLSMSEVHCCILSLYMVFQFLLRMPLDVRVLMMQFISQVMFISRPVFQSCICLERYLAVVHPTVFLRFRPLRYRLACCIVDWLLILVYSTVTVFTLSEKPKTCMQIFVSLSFLLLLLYFGICVLYVLRQPGPGDGGRDHESRNNMKRKAYKIIMTTLVFTSFTQSFSVFLTGTKLFCGSQQSILWFLLLNLSISIVGGFIIPLLYLHRTGKLPCIKF